MNRVILASASPRRRELLMQMGLTDFDVRPARGEEAADTSLSPEELVKTLALQKAREIRAQAHPTDTVIGADTVVVHAGRILGKPRDRADAEEMLRALSGGIHQVYTGVAVLRGDKELVEYEKTDVEFRKLDEEEIAAYAATDEPMDKAGSYGIQGGACIFVKGIRGDYFNVVGLPLCRLSGMLRRADAE